MKSIKKIITTIAVLLITTSIFAQITQTSDYETHLQKGKEYENQKKWIYALGEYYDALDSIFADIKNEDIIYSNKYQNKENKEYTVYIPYNNTFEEYKIPDVQEACNSYKNLAEKIKNGNPGYGEFDDFTLLDNWILLLKEFEKYWTENSPWQIYFEKPERTALNRENRTATYKIFITSENTPKYQEILKIVETGLRETNLSEWNENLTSWPNDSVYDNNVQKEDDDMIPDGIPLVRKRIEFTPMNRKPYYKLTRKSPATITTINGVFDIKFNIVDSNGNILLESERYLFFSPDYHYHPEYSFNDVPQSTMKLIDSDEVNIVLDSAYLKYGTMDETSMNIVTSLSETMELKFNTNKIPCFSWKNSKPLFSYQGLLPKIESYLKGIN